jgi:DNA replication protein DnaC
VTCSKSSKIATWQLFKLATSQFPVDHWHDAIGKRTVADAILDRLVHNAHRLTLDGESMRKTRSSLTATTESE